MLGSLGANPTFGIVILLVAEQRARAAPGAEILAGRPTVPHGLLRWEQHLAIEVDQVGALLDAVRVVADRATYALISDVLPAYLLEFIAEDNVALVAAVAESVGPGALSSLLRAYRCWGRPGHHEGRGHPAGGVGRARIYRCRLQTPHGLCSHRSSRRHGC